MRSLKNVAELYSINLIFHLASQSHNFIGDRRGHNHGTNIIKGLPNVQNLPVGDKVYNNNKLNEEVPKIYNDKGILNLIDRGIVPHTAKIDITPSPIFHDKSELHDSR